MPLGNPEQDRQIIPTEVSSSVELVKELIGISPEEWDVQGNFREQNLHANIRHLSELILSNSARRAEVINLWSDTVNRYQKRFEQKNPGEWSLEQRNEVEMEYAHAVADYITALVFTHHFSPFCLIQPMFLLQETVREGYRHALKRTVDEQRIDSEQQYSLGVSLGNKALLCIPSVTHLIFKGLKDAGELTEQQHDAFRRYRATISRFSLNNDTLQQYEEHARGTVHEASVRGAISFPGSRMVLPNLSVEDTAKRLYELYFDPNEKSNINLFSAEGAVKKAIEIVLADPRSPYYLPNLLINAQSEEFKIGVLSVLVPIEKEKLSIEDLRNFLDLEYTMGGMNGKKIIKVIKQVALRLRKGRSKYDVLDIFNERSIISDEDDYLNILLVAVRNYYSE